MSNEFAGASYSRKRSAAITEPTMETTRTFIALAIDEASNDEICRLTDPLARRFEQVRWAGRKTLHITLVFLGEVENARLADVCDAARAAASLHPAYDLSLSGVGAFPNLAQPRTVWVGVDQGRTETIALQETLTLAMEPFGYRRENRPFTPHVTIGKSKRHGRIPPALSQELRKHESWTGGGTWVEEALVMSSDLRPEGPIYTIIGRAPLSS